VKLIDGSFLMCHEYLACPLVELLKMAKTSSGSDGVLHHPPEAFDGVEVMAAVGRQEMEAQLAMIVVEGCVEFVRPMNAAAINDHHDLFLSFLEGRHDLVHILAPLLGIKVRHDFIEDFRGPILDGAEDAEQHAAGNAAPRAILQPRLAFEAFFTFDVALAQRARGDAGALRGAPPARTGQGKAPEDGFVLIEQNDFTTASPVFEGGKFERAIGEISRGGIKATGGTIVAYMLFFNIQRTLSRPSCTPVCWARTVASSRQLHWEWIEPCSRGS
jgi:hypothetical protein